MESRLACILLRASTGLHLTRSDEQSDCMTSLTDMFNVGGRQVALVVGLSVWFLLLALCRGLQLGAASIVATSAQRTTSFAHASAVEPPFVTKKK